MKRKTINEKIKENILRLEVNGRGGGIEISLCFVGKKYEVHKMTAYQNSLGGGVLGKIANSCTNSDWKEDEKLVKVAEDLRKYYHALSNPEGTFESFSYEQNQKLPVSAY